ncbi:MAG: hypothetical protein IMF19_03110 [Proteobacteria bacterium]|nr:hypothetical protein [Pseudomonadota bacterium]
MMKNWPENMEYWDDEVEGYTYLIDLVILLNLPAIKHFLYKNFLGLLTALEIILENSEGLSTKVSGNLD